jgi:hypothetical protein
MLGPVGSATGCTRVASEAESPRSVSSPAVLCRAGRSLQRAAAWKFPAEHRSPASTSAVHNLPRGDCQREAGRVPSFSRGTDRGCSKPSPHAPGSWSRTFHFGKKLSADPWNAGHPNRLQHGWFATTPGTWACAFRTRPSTNRSSSRRVERCGNSSPRTYVQGESGGSLMIATSREAAYAT